ncbi:lipid-A-disaccharide synthase [Maricaulis parjimensis]|uniref:lipid-A-disaccharide synthase n=1 Tax=Maricaulis parjimensis TaxID=144023 RepID=UPI001939D251|nr:lipid-A-disaccharide synthase [Maricaulis parjimensis]
MADPKSVFIVAAERSGDHLGAGLIRALRDAAGDGVRLAGVGGDAMAGEGIESAVDTSGLSILGLFDGLKAYGRVKAKVAETVAEILRVKPDAVVLIDSWGFMLRVAQGVRAADPSIRLIKYVGPQVFATRPGRAKTLANTVDHLMTILSFDAPYYEPHGLPVTFVGNPTLDRLPTGDGAAFRERHGLAQDQEIMLVLLGSRTSEIRRLWKSFEGAVKSLTGARPNLQPVFIMAAPVEDLVRPRLEAGGWMIVREDEKADAFAAADVALACSGTVVTELATAGVPTVTGYRLGWMTWAVLRLLRVMKAPFISLVNIAAGRMLVPEFVQTQCQPRQLSQSVSGLLDDPERRKALSEELVAATRQLRGEGDASRRAAETVISLL